jgi:GNAT superfamily N-acetyltransferase
MLLIRDYREESDAYAVGRLIADTLSERNQTFAPTEERNHDWGPFQHARSLETGHQAEIARLIRAEMVFVADDEGEIVGVLRGNTKRMGQLMSLYVRGDYQWYGIGRRLIERFEQDCLWEKVRQVKLAAKIYAVPFYLKRGYKRSTGVRTGFSFEGRGLVYQPMKKEIWERH